MTDEPDDETISGQRPEPGEAEAVEPSRTAVANTLRPAALTYAIWFLAYLYAWVLGWIDAGWPALIFVVGIAAGINLLAWAGLKAGLDARLRDPGLAASQAFLAILFVSGALMLVSPVARGPLATLAILWFIPPLFRSGKRQVQLLAGTMAVLYLLVNFRVFWGEDPGQDYWTQLFWWMVLAVVLFGVVDLADRVNEQRAEEQQQLRELVDLRRQVQRLTVLDPLTQIYKRNHVLRMLEQERARVDRYGGTFSVCLFSLDRMREINAVHGNVTGDQMLRRLASSLEKDAREPDYIGRHTGTGFLLVLPTTELRGAITCAERLRANIAEFPVRTNAGPVTMTTSVGVTEYQKGEPVHVLIERAHRALREARSRGGNTIQARASSSGRRDVDGRPPTTDKR